MTNSIQDLMDSLTSIDELMEDLQTLDIGGLCSTEDIINDLPDPPDMEEFLKDIPSGEDLFEDLKTT